MRGTYLLNAPLVLKSGCILQDEGEGTLIKYSGSDVAIRLAPYTTAADIAKFTMNTTIAA